MQQGGVHNNYNEYKDFSDRETEAHICAAFMEMSGMATVDGKPLQTRILTVHEYLYNSNTQ